MDSAPFTTVGPVLLASTDIAPIVGVDLVAAGRIAALHAMSDLFASGGRPRWGLVSLVLALGEPIEYGEALLAGIQAECTAHSVEILGGQTIWATEALAGLTVIGDAIEGRRLSKHGGVPGDVLLLSKPVGSGLVLRGFKLGLLDDASLEPAIAVMCESNARASRAAVEAGVHACTDISGFGLLGHLCEMVPASLGASLSLAKVPVLAEAAQLPGTAAETAWLRSNRDYASSLQSIRGAMHWQEEFALFDPQTNGGLLVAAPTQGVSFLEASGFRQIGEITEAAGLHLSE